MWDFTEAVWRTLPDQHTSWLGRHIATAPTDLLAYQERQREDRRAALDRMTEDASEAGIYGGTPEDYAAALKNARKRAARREGAS